jgi:hypothetical protein
MELAPVYDLSAVNQRHFRKFQFLVQRDTSLYVDDALIPTGLTLVCQDIHAV